MPIRSEGTLLPANPIPGRPRFELKFLIPVGVKEQLLNQIKFALLPDSHGDDRGGYLISSLYYDTRDLEAYWEKLDGVLQRQKFRLRYYGGSEGGLGAAFFEIKHRYNSCVSKERLRLPSELAEGLLSHEAELEALGGAVEQPTLAQSAMLSRLLRFHHRRQLVPALIVAYRREAWVGKDDPSLRVTFDHLITCHPSDDYLSPGTRVGVPTLDPRRLVLEIKFDQSLPRWLQQRLVLEELRPIRYSKYVESALAFGLEQAV